MRTSTVGRKDILTNLLDTSAEHLGSLANSKTFRKLITSLPDHPHLQNLLGQKLVFESFYKLQKGSLEVLNSVLKEAVVDRVIAGFYEDDPVTLLWAMGTTPDLYCLEAGMVVPEIETMKMGRRSLKAFFIERPDVVLHPFLRKLKKETTH